MPEMLILTIDVYRSWWHCESCDSVGIFYFIFIGSQPFIYAHTH